MDASELPPKKVYVLGAGFSRDAGLPLQAGIIEKIRARGDIAHPLLREILSEGDKSPRLEDVFTLFDQAVSRQQYCLGHTWQQIEQVRRELLYNILCVFHESTPPMNAAKCQRYCAFAAHLIAERVQAGDTDKFSIISLNWDCLFENAVYHCIREVGMVGDMDLDYCCYTTPLGGSPHTPSILQKAKGIVNLKLMKLHGSVNWLSCPNCNRMYTGVGSDERDWDRYVFPQACPECKKFLGKLGEASGRTPPNLEPFIITPTFLKVFDNPHIQMTWHNAYLDLAAADDVVFIGYSLPEADYHLRTLLRRSIRPEARIRAVLTKDDKPKCIMPKNLRECYAASRYQDFFGKDRVEIRSSGVKGFCRSLPELLPLARPIARLRRLLKTSPAFSRGS